ncbi:histidine phosphatase family protein [Nakamurella antarctica]|uniref:histidine phosphatase family protein n=1 Tax=Nakamurella antarctica TaxID=1902245 RepID=UPI0013DE4205|nr:histidine phosphatase family protein [Nakamurella antarctica]
MRHGQSDWNLAGRLQGQSDEARLTTVGLQQAAEVAAALQVYPVRRIITSDLQRAQQTAQIIGAATGIEPEANALLREICLGSLEGGTSAQASAWWEVNASNGADFDPNLAPPGGESFTDALGRVRKLLKTLWQEESDVVLVSHGDTIRVALADHAGEQLRHMAWRPVGNCEINTVVL